MQLTATLLQLLPAQSGQSKNGPWKKQDIIVQTDEKFPKKVCLSIWGDKIDEKQLILNSNLQLEFDIESREFNGKWYTDIKVWKVTVLNPNEVVTDLPPAPPSPFVDDDEELEDLPF